MNLVGKIFTVLIFVMSLIFMSFAVALHATHKNWKKVYDNPKEEATLENPPGVKWQLADAEAHNEVLKEKLEDIKTELKTQEAAKRQALTRLETERDLLRQENTALEKEEARLKQEVRKAVALTEATHNTLLALRKEVDRLRLSIRQAEIDRDAHFKEVVRLTDELHQAVNERERLKARQVTLAADLAKANEVLRKFGYKAEPALYQGPPIADGVVLAVRSKELIEISLGTDDGLLKGHTLEVYRLAGGPPKYVGKIEVLKAGPDKAACKIDPRTQRSHVQVGDRVATKLREPARVPHG